MTRARPRGRPAKPTTALVPAAVAQAPAPAATDLLLSADAIDTFTRAVGGRDQLADTLAVAGAGPQVERITTLLLDPRYAQWSLARICQMTGITVADLFAAYRKAAIARSHIEATHIIASRLPPIVEDVMTRAAPQVRVCPACAGASTPGSCPTCGGTGTVQTEPDLDRQKLALELGQLLEKKGGLIVQQNNAAIAAVSATAPGSLEQLQQAVGDLLFGSRRAQGDGDDGVDDASDDALDHETPGAPPAELPDLPDEPGDEPPAILDPADAADID